MLSQRLHPSPFTRKLNVDYNLAGLLAQPKLIAFPLKQWHEVSDADLAVPGLTATGIAPDFHRFPFSSSA